VWTESDGAGDVEGVGDGAGFFVSEWSGSCGGACGGVRVGRAGIRVLDYAEEEVVGYYCCGGRASCLEVFGFIAEFFAFWNREDLGIWGWSWW